MDLECEAAFQKIKSYLLSDYRLHILGLKKEII